MSDAMLIFVSPYFQFCLFRRAVMAAHFSFVIEGIKETKSSFSKIVTYYSLAFVLFRGFCMVSVSVLV